MVRQAHLTIPGLSGKLLVTAIASWGLIAEDVRIAMVANAKPLEDTILRQVFKDGEIGGYTEGFRKEWPSHSVFEVLDRYSSENDAAREK